jgi:DNA-binding protein HU-beta
MPTPKTIEKIKDEVGAEITAMLKRGEEVFIPGVGKIVRLAKAARMARNPATGDAVQVPARVTAKLKPAAALNQALNA